MESPALNVDWPPSGRYLLAVSGGADSMALLDIMASSALERGYELVVAHFDHGLRVDSALDRKLVEQAASKYGLPFEYHTANLQSAPEAVARQGRHVWLSALSSRHHAAVVTAHHQDDLIETSLLNLARGTGRRGLAPMYSGSILRPLLAVSRPELRDYLKAHGITWREDPTNADLTNPRNYLRHQILRSASATWRDRYLSAISRLITVNTGIDQIVSAILEDHRREDGGYSFPSSLVCYLSLPEIEEIIVAGARRIRPGIEPSHRAVQELALFAKTAPPHRRRELRSGIELMVDSEAVYLLGS